MDPVKAAILTRQIADEMQTAFWAEIKQAKRYRDDPEYRDRFNEAAMPLLEGEDYVPYGCWPDSLEPRAIKTSNILENITKCLDFLQEAEVASDWARVHLVALSGIIKQFQLKFYDQFAGLNIIRSLAYKNEVRMFGGPLAPHILYLLVPITWTGNRVGRLIWSDDYLDPLRQEVESLFHRLGFICSEIHRLFRLQELVTIDQDRFSLHFQGKECPFGPTREFYFVERLVHSINRWVSFKELSEASDGDDQGDKLAPVKFRACDKLKKANLNLLSDLIKGKPGYYGLFLDGSY